MKINIQFDGATSGKTGVGKHDRNVLKCLDIAGIKYEFGVGDGINISSGFGKFVKRGKEALNVGIVQDLYPIAEPWRYNILRQIIARLKINSLLKSDYFVAISCFTRYEMYRLADPYVYNKGAHVIYPAIDYQIFKKGRKGSTNVPQIIYIGSEEPRQNLDVLVDSLSKISKKGVNFKLLKVGTQGFRNGRMEFLKSLNAAGIADKVEIVEKINDDELVKRIRESEALVYPCRYAGFGYPPLEAIGCGTPSIVKDTLITRETTEKAAYRFTDQADLQHLLEQAIAGKLKEPSKEAAKALKDRYCFNTISRHWKDYLEGLVPFDPEMGNWR